ncbi:hypothetical protein [Crocosphaera sp. XPORK-15E]|uniref:hypothetical protein n=1 Tax=Crocosphaera sp. XPORK-15E TaxID=3110247 RepID=UPI002B218DBE|nr:hypothetical protein [Crocosphaera sp. XPORK-15E]MEA5534520.1 hypothetical protein [Crocosphaera sp. XPORK-15E]
MSNNDYIKSPSSKRLEKFLETVVKEIHNLQKNFDEKIDLESPSFQTTLIYALQIASRNHQDEKINALKNAVLNSMLINSIDADKQSIFLTYIDELTPSHLKALDIINNFSQYAKTIIVPYISEAKGKASKIRTSIPILKELKNNEDFYNKIIKDLEDKSLVNFDDCRIRKNTFSLSQEVRNIRIPQVNSLDDSKLTESIKNIIEVQKKLADYMESIPVTSLA